MYLVQLKNLSNKIITIIKNKISHAFKLNLILTWKNWYSGRRYFTEECAKETTDRIIKGHTEVHEFYSWLMSFQEVLHLLWVLIE